MQEGDSVKDAVQAVPTAQPCIVVRGTIKEVILVVEKKTLTTIQPKELPLILLGAYIQHALYGRMQESVQLL